jgi:hypothetical protein
LVWRAAGLLHGDHVAAGGDQSADVEAPMIMHAGPMTERDKYAVSVDELVASANVPFDEQVQEQEADDPPEHDQTAGHLPGNVRPYGA